MTSPRTTSRPRYRTTAVVLAAALALAACGGSSDESSPDASNTTSTAPDTLATTEAGDTTTTEASEGETTTTDATASTDTTTVAESLQGPPPPTQTPAPTTVAPGEIRPRPELPKDPEGLTEQSFDEAGGLACANAELALFSLDQGDPEGVEDYMVVAREQARASELSQFNDLAPSLDIATTDPAFRETVDLFLDSCVTVGYEVL